MKLTTNLPLSLLLFIPKAGYLKLKGLFVSSITGNLVVMAASVSTDRGLIARSLIVAAFALGCFILKQLMEVLRIYNMSFHFQLFFGHASILLLILATTIFGIIFNDEIDATSVDSWFVIFPACLLAVSMGYQNTVCETSFRNAPPTTVMTMTLVRGANALSTALSQYVILNKLRKESLVVIRNCDNSNNLENDNVDDIDKCIDLINTQNNRIRRNDIISSLAPNIRDEARQQLLNEIESHTHIVYDYLDKFVVISRPLVMFMIGSVIGAKLMEVIDFYCMIVPLFIILILVIDLVLVLIFRGTEYLEEDFRSRSSSLSGVMVSVQTAVRRQQRLQELEDEEKQIQQPQQVVLNASCINRSDSLRSMIDEDCS